MALVPPSLSPMATHSSLDMGEGVGSRNGDSPSSLLGSERFVPACPWAPMGLGAELDRGLSLAGRVQAELGEDWERSQN